MNNKKYTKYFWINTFSYIQRKINQIFELFLFFKIKTIIPIQTAKVYCQHRRPKPCASGQSETVLNYVDTSSSSAVFKITWMLPLVDPSNWNLRRKTASAMATSDSPPQWRSRYEVLEVTFTIGQSSFPCPCVLLALPTLFLVNCGPGEVSVCSKLTVTVDSLPGTGHRIIRSRFRNRRSTAS